VARIAVLEPRAEIRNALVHCVGQSEAVECLEFKTVRQWETNPVTKAASLYLVNVDAWEALFSRTASQLTALPEGRFAVPYSLHVDSDALFLAAPGGRSGYCFKRLGPGEMLNPVLSLVRNGASASALNRAVHDYFQGVAQVPPAAPDLAGRRILFTRREHEVLALLSKGYLDKEIARELGISAWTVHEHVKRVFEKLGVHSRLEATLAYLQK